MAFKTFMSDDGRIILHADENFKLPGEISIDGESPLPFDPSVLIAIGEHYFDRALYLALDEVKFVVGDLHKLGEEELKAHIAELGSNIRHLHDLRRERQDQPQFKIRCTGCGMAYDPPLMNGYICAECSSIWNSVDEKWKLSQEALRAQQIAKRHEALPEKAKPSPGTREALEREQAILTDAYKVLHENKPQESSELEFQGRKFVFRNGTWFPALEEKAVEPSKREKAIEEVRQIEMATAFKSRNGREAKEADRFQYETRMYKFDGTKFIEEA